MSIKNFNSWYNSVKESEVNSAEPKVAEPTVANKQGTDQKSDIISDVDNIIHSLETLAGELTEEHGFDIPEVDQINEGAAGPFGDMIMEDPFFQLIGFGVAGIAVTAGVSIKAIKDSSRNKKIALSIESDFNKLRDMQIKSLKLEATSNKLKKKSKELLDQADATSGEKSDKIRALRSKVEDQIDSIGENKVATDDVISKYESSVLSKYSSENVTGFFSGKVLKAVAGKREEVEKSVLKYKLKIYGDDESSKVKEDISKRIAALDKKAKERDAEIKAELAENTKKVEDILDKASPEDLEALEKAKEKAKNGDEDTDNEIEDTPEVAARKKLLAKTKDALAKAQESGNDEEVEKLKELIDRIEAKESWQIHGTKLGSLIESEIKKIENSLKLNENRHVNVSIKDRFSNLI
jgi:hypothetical protein